MRSTYCAVWNQILFSRILNDEKDGLDSSNPLDKVYLEFDYWIRKRKEQNAFRFKNFSFSEHYNEYTLVFSSK